MKKYLFSIVVLLFVANVWAERVSQEDAALVANHFINVERGTSGARKAPAKRMVLKQAAPAAEENQFYIYENADGEGWVLVAADDVAHPILAYSETGHFRTDNMPANIKVWLNGYNRQIKRAAQDGLVAPESIQQEWNELRSKARKAASSVVVNPLIQSGWSQSSPYYNSCPTDSKGRCVTGCVATAMAQVMYYHKWPKQGTGSHSVIVNNKTYTANFGQTTYDWDNMLDNYTHLDANGYEVVNSGLTTAQKNAVATLMYHCGVAVDMDYSADVSGAYTIDFNGYFSRKGTMCAETALTQFFGYNTETVIGYYRNGDSSTGMKSWTKAQWTAMLKEELDAARPIMYAGTGCDDPNDNNTCYGHSFICDGYDSSNKFHFNFGWTNWCDGYYDIDALETNDPGTGGGNGNYSLDQDVIIGIQPPITGHTVEVNGTGCTIVPNTYGIENGNTLTATITPKDDTYDFTSIVVTLGNTTLIQGTHYTLSSDYKTLTVKASAITGDSSNNLTITAVWTKTRCTYLLMGEHCTTDLEGTLNMNQPLNLTITPATGYSLADEACWAVEMGEDMLEYGVGFTYNTSNGAFSISQVTGDVTIVAEAGIEVAWEADGSLFASNLAPAGKVAIPTSEPEACDGKVFVGWCADENYSDETTAPTFVKNGDEVTSATTFYAVFATQGTGGSGNYEKVSSAPSDWSGNYLIVNETAKVAFKGLSSANSTDAVTITNNVIEYSAALEKDEVIIASMTGGYSIRMSNKATNNTGLYLSGTSGSNTIIFGYNAELNTLEFSSGNVTITSKTSVLRYNNASNNGNLFRYYKSTSYSNQQPIQLYRKTNGGISYSDYTTSCGAPAEKYAIQINSTEHGSLSTSPSGEAAAGKTVTVTATPETHYHLATLTVKDASNADVTVNGTGNTRTFTMPEKAVTISATFAQDDKYTINFYVGNNIQKTESLFAGETATAPSVVAPCEDYTHVGWVTSTIPTETESAPITVTNFTVSGAQDYYAVFSRTEEGESGNQEITLDATKDTTFPKDGITLSTTSGVLNNGSDYRIYKGAKLTITSTVGDMSSIVFTFDGTYNGGGWATSYTPNAATWTSPACTSGDSGKQARIKKIIITIGSGASSTTYYTTAPNCEECTNAVTVTKGTASHGSFALDKTGEQSTCGGKVVVNVTNISPADGYRFKEITQVGLTEGVTIDQTAKTVTYAKKVNGASAINVLFEEIPTYLVRFYDNGTMVSEQEVLEGQSAEKPNNPTPACSQYTFVGWWTAELAADNTEEETWITDFTATKKQDYYAVYSLIEKGKGDSEIAYMTFNTNSSDGSTEYTTTLNILNHVVASHNGLTSCEGSKLYDGIGGVKLGSNSSSGYITLTLTASASIKKVIVNASKYGSDTGNIEVEAGETSLGTQEPANNLVFEATTPIETNQVTVSTTSKRAYVKSIYIYAGDKDVTYYTSVMDCSVTPTGTVTVEDQTKAQKILRDGQLLIIRDGKTYNSLGHIIE